MDVESGEESTVEMEMSPICRATQEAMEIMGMSCKSEGEMEQMLADLTPSRSERSSEDACTPSVGMMSDAEPMSEEKQKKPLQVQYGLEKFFFGKNVKPAIEENRKEILKAEALVRGRGRPTLASLALQEARKRGEVMVVAAVSDFNKVVEAEAAKMLAMKDGSRSLVGAQQSEARMVQTCAAGVGALLLVKNSNRALKGAAKQRNEEGAATKLEMAKQMLQMRPAFATEGDWKLSMCKLYKKPWKTLKPIVDGKKEWEKRVKDLKLGKGSTGTTAAKGTCCKGGRWLMKGGVGARATGGGRKDKFSHIKTRVKYWLEKERSLCHHVDKVDLVEEFLEQCEDEVEECLKQESMNKNEEGEEVKDKNIVKKLSFSAAVNGDVEVTSADADLITAEDYVQQLEDVVQWRELLQDRILKLKSSEKYSDTFGGRLIRDIGAKLLQPGRMSVLSMEEEEQRVKATWKDFDVALWLAAFGAEDVLEKFVGSPQKFIEARSELIIGFSDQIPVWVKIGRKKEVFCEREVKPRLNSEDFRKLQKERLKKQLIKDVEEEEEKQLEDCNPHEEEEKQLEDCKPHEEEEKKVEDCKPHEEEEKKVEDCKPPEDEEKKVEDCKPEEEEEKKVEDCKPHEEEEKKVEDCKPPEDEEKKVEDCKPEEEDEATDVEMPEMTPGLSSGEDEVEKLNKEKSLKKLKKLAKKMRKQRVEKDKKEPQDSSDDSSDGSSDEDAVPLSEMEVEDENLEGEMEGVDMTIEDAGTMINYWRNPLEPLGVFESL